MIDAEPQSPRNLKLVSRFEYELLNILRFLLGHLDAQQGLQLVCTKRLAPRFLSDNCMHLVKDTLAKSLVLHLTRAGGWRNEKFLEKGNPVGGRVWDRIKLDERKLVFSDAPLGFLIWLTASNPSDTKEKPEKWDAVEDLTAADQLFFTLAAAALRSDNQVYEVVRSKSVFSRNPLAWLFHPDDFVESNTTTAPSFANLFTEPGAAILECLQPRLMKHWLASERTKSHVTDWTVMSRRGAAELLMFREFLAAAEKANRKDLARFLLKALSQLFENHTPDAPYWIGGLTIKQPTRLADRIAIQRGALAVVQQAEVFARWDRVARSVGYFDDDYQASQLLKEDYEAANVADFTAKAKRVLEQIEPLKV